MEITFVRRLRAVSPLQNRENIALNLKDKMASFNNVG